MACTRGSRSGGPARSQAAGSASIALSVAYRCMPSAAGLLQVPAYRSDRPLRRDKFRAVDVGSGSAATRRAQEEESFDRTRTIVWRLSWRISLQPRPRSSATSAVPLVPVTGGAATYGPERLQSVRDRELKGCRPPTATAAYAQVATMRRSGQWLHDSSSDDGPQGPGSFFA